MKPQGSSTSPPAGGGDIPLSFALGSTPPMMSGLIRASTTGGVASSRSYGDLLAAAETRASLGITQFKSKVSRPIAQRAAKSKTFTEMPPPSVYIRERDGQVLGRGLVLKADHFPGGDRAKLLQVNISGAPNFRRMRPLPCYAVGQPSVHG
jgi:hypothetical protein